MPVKKKKFIDKKNAVTFHLVHRSQKDPLQADEDAPQHVLLPVKATDKESAEHRAVEQRKYGIHFDDDYDYLQHLKDVEELHDVHPGAEVYGGDAKSNSKPQIQLPSQVFASEVETDVGLLNKAVPIVGPQVDWDPDIVAALDEDFNFDDPENILEDDFVIEANADGSDPQPYHDDGIKDSEDGSQWVDCRQYKEYSSDNEYENDSDVGSLDGSFETKSHFTNYSMTSSVIRRNNGLTLLDDRFEKLYAAYDDSELGALDHEDICGYVEQNSKMLSSVLEQFEAEQEKATLDEVREDNCTSDVVRENVIDNSQEDSSENELENMIKIDVEPQKEKWDCESILSTYSNIYNHPKKITEPKSGKPRSQRQSCSSESQIDPVEVPKANTLRPINENPEERKLRKQAVKKERKLRREEKVKNKNAFKCEEIRQKKEELNLKHNLQAIRLG